MLQLHPAVIFQADHTLTKTAGIITERITAAKILSQRRTQHTGIPKLPYTFFTPQIFQRSMIPAARTGTWIKQL